MTVATIDAAARPPSQTGDVFTRRVFPAVLRVFMVDAMPLAAYGLHALVGSTGGISWCGAAGSMASALMAVRDLCPHVVLVDGELDRDARGVRALSEAQIRTVGIVRGEDRAAADYVRAARAARVSGLVSRSTTPGVLLSAIRAVHGGQTFVDPRLGPVLARLLATGGGIVEEQASLLTRRQQETLALIARGLRNAEIARTLTVSVETVRTHVRDILRKLDARDRAHAVARGYQLGLLDV